MCSTFFNLQVCVHTILSLLSNVLLIHGIFLFDLAGSMGIYINLCTPSTVLPQEYAFLVFPCIVTQAKGMLPITLVYPHILHHFREYIYKHS